MMFDRQEMMRNVVDVENETGVDRKSTLFAALLVSATITNVGEQIVEQIVEAIQALEGSPCDVEEFRLAREPAPSLENSAEPDFHDGPPMDDVPGTAP